MEICLPAHLFTDRWRERTLVYQRRTLLQVLVDLGQREVTSVLIEGGGQVLGQAFEQGLVDEVQFFLTPWLAAGPVSATAGKPLALPHGATLCETRFERLGQDVLRHRTNHPDEGLNPDVFRATI